VDSSGLSAVRRHLVPHVVNREITERPLSKEESYRQIEALIDEMLRELAVVDPEEVTAVQWWVPTR